MPTTHSGNDNDLLLNFMILTTATHTTTKTIRVACKFLIVGSKPMKIRWNPNVDIFMDSHLHLMKHAIW